MKIWKVLRHDNHSGEVTVEMYCDHTGEMDNIGVANKVASINYYELYEEDEDAEYTAEEVTKTFNKI